VEKSNKGLVYIALFVIQILFGINYSTSKIIVGKVDPFVWSNIRFFIAGIVMLLITLALRRPHPKISKSFFVPLFPLAILGMALGQGLFLFGLRLTTSVNTAILTSTIPILTVIIVVLRRQESLTFNKVIGIILAFLGVILIRDLSGMSFGSETFMGDILVFCGALCFALYLSFGKKYLMKYDNMWVTTYMFLIASFLMFLYNIPRIDLFNIPQDTTPAFWFSGIYTIIGATLITYFLNNWALRRAASGSVALFIYLQPVVAGIIGYLFLDEQITLRMGLCSALILTGVIVTLIPSFKRNT
jgi:drug/metabolite transporter (DMT)-like permease